MFFWHYNCSFKILLKIRWFRMFFGGFKEEIAMSVRNMLLNCFFCFAALTGFVYAEDDEGVSVDLSLDYVGKYIWRGQNVVDDPVLWPNVDINFGKWTATFWGNFETTNINGQNDEFTEFDYILDYSDDLPGFDGIGFSFGTIYYYFPSAGDTTEIYWGLNFDLPLNPSFTIYHDVHAAAGTFVSFNLEHSIDKIFELGPDLPVGLTLGLELTWGSSSYNHAYWGVNDNKLNYWQLTASFPVELSDGWTFAGNLYYVTLLGDSIRNSNAFREESDYFFAGISLSKSF